MCMATAFILDLVLGLHVLSFGINYLLLILLMLPLELIFICIGIMLGASFKAKDSIYIFVCIIIVTIMTSNTFFDVSSFGSGYEIFCKILPFYPTYTGLYCLIEGFTEAFPYYFVTIGYAIGLLVLTVIIYKIKMLK